LNKKIAAGSVATAKLKGGSKTVAVVPVFIDYRL